MLKSEEYTVEVLTSDLHEERRRRHAAEKEKRETERRAEMSERKADALQSQLTAKMDELSSLMQQLVQFMMGDGSVSLSESLKDSVIAGVRVEFEKREDEMRQFYELQIASLRNEIAFLEGNNNQDSNYALKEYPCILHCLEDGSVDFSNNCCERQIRRIAKYCNNSFFVGSPEAGKHFARLQSVFGNIRNHKLNPQIYLCDVFRKIKNIATGAKEEMVNLLAHRWQMGLLLAK